MLRRNLSWLISVSIAWTVSGCGAIAADPGFSSTNGSNGNPNSDFEKPLFPEPLFSDQPMFSTDSMATQLDADIQHVQEQRKAPPPQKPTVASQINTSEVDQEMRRQVRAVARLLYNYSLRNHSYFPSAVNSMDEMYAMQVQCEELVPNNPYNYGATETMNWGIPATFNANGSAATGSPVWGDQWTQHLQAQNDNRVLLITDQSLNHQMADQWADDPPQTWTAAPGTITAIGNNQGFFIVWGAGADGKPLKNPMNGKTFIVAVSTSGTVNDQIAPSEI